MMKPNMLNLTLCLILISTLISTTLQKRAQSTNRFDYVVIGGGTAGLAVASRLSENKNISVLVLEAGRNGLNNTGISIPGFTGSTFRSQIDWNYTTVPLSRAGNRTMIYPRGKVLGGCSAINFMVSTKASRQDYDTFESLGNPGWGWSEFDEASRKSEKFIAPSTKTNFTFTPKYHGTRGPVKTSFPKYIPPNVQSFFPAAASLKHARTLEDSFEGVLQGPYYFPSTIDEKAERMTSAQAYYFPIASRSNLVVLLDCEVDRLIVSKSKTGEIDVQGVEYSSKGLKQKVLAHKEIILSAGSIGTPAILERSGMGDPSILKKFGIPVILDLPGVGSNLADHAVVFNTYQLEAGLTSGDNLQTDPEYAAEQLKLYNEDRAGILTQVNPLLDYQPLKSILTKKELEEGLKYLKSKPPSLPQKIFDAIKEQLLHGTPIEFIVANQGLSFIGSAEPPSASLIGLGTALQYPLSRGTTHISSRDPKKAPLIDPGYFKHPYDLWLLAKATKYSRKIMTNVAWSGVISKEFSPGGLVRSDKEWTEYVKNTSSTTYHAIGTAAMLPRKLGGVVDPDLKVYDVNNLRIVDASIFPTHIAAHPTMSIYALAELAAEKILNSAES
ncbi:hypothetical protein DFH28DRAFT_978844 [Melampsora americana]|nr:hypothetical protein DFH28DRAFT_978844 [Melampsora americana]